MGIYLEERKEIKDLKLLQSPYIQEAQQKAGEMLLRQQRGESELIVQALMVSCHPHLKQVWEVWGAKEAKRWGSLQSGCHQQEQSELPDIFLFSLQQNTVYLPN